MFLPLQKKKIGQRGFTLVEVLIGAFILCALFIGVYGGFVSVIKTVRASRLKTDAMLLANEQIEIARNLPYQEVGIVDGIPAGKIPREQFLSRGGNSFKVTASIRNVDDIFDGTLGSTTKNDLSPGDYKQMQVDIECLSCVDGIFPPQKIYTTIAPKNLETATGNGSLFVKVFNSNGDPVSSARVRIQNNTTVVDELTDNNGIFQLVDAPPGALSYQISVTKNGYSSEGTYPNTVQYPNPITPPATVLGGQLTQISFSIDKTSSLDVGVVNNTCLPVSGVPVRVVGQKKIGQSPDVYKFDQTFTSGSGLINLPTLEWDTYKLSISTTSSRFLAGSSSFLPLLISPNSSSQITLTTSPRNPNGLLVSVHDSVTGLPLSGADVSVDSQTLTTSQGFFTQTDWSGGSGQSLFENETMFSETDGNIDFNSSAGEVRLRSSLGKFLASGFLTSSVFDSGSTSTQYVSIRFSPADQATSTGSGSVRLQIASGNDPATTTWNFYGPDGRTSSYYSVPGEAINAVHNGDRYIRYKLFLSTSDEMFSPNISDVGLTFTAICTPPGQAYFQSLSLGQKNVSVSRAGYKNYSSVFDINDVWQGIDVFLEPN
jgi:prepilin-type N-terminal cleavage/methylation domain-containing protein